MSAKLTLPNHFYPRLSALLCGASLTLFVACDGMSQLVVDFTEEEWARARAAAQPTALPEDPTNRFADDPQVAAFGQLLFFEERLSPQSVSCASCHPPEENWGTGEVQLGAFARQVPSLLNVAHQRWLTSDGHKDSLWSQMIGPLEHAREMGSDRLYLAHAIFQHEELRSPFESFFFALPPMDDAARFPSHARPSDDPEDPLQKAWSSMTESDRAQIDDVLVAVGKAIAAFERTLLTGPSAFDRFVQEVDDGPHEQEIALSSAEQRGAKLFFGNASCHLCHSGPMFSDFEFHNLGLPSQKSAVPDLGRLAGVDRLLRDPFNLASRHSDAEDAAVADKVRFLRASSDQAGQFKTPSLRNVARSAPYMHTGELASLRDVIAFYVMLPGSAGVGHREETLKELQLDDGDIDDLSAFLHALSAEGSENER